ncbi:seven transmembrane domain protein [Cavenderia fasciculata]|uniref:BOS complex subunit TMEM147 n=1 Tax=Cavenderia fasciculata TaxID=261658 RepID=F4PU98_CACFS|nr:seven transmembrane domain protein [Cavenderia fasciculata]EGG21813.1 seven transmembrane domain protein [Cavenderia fasciculata]|eukprot:XP_004359663.1 seven transmembrane domain protein [Cavenderia fasciculata]
MILVIFPIAIYFVSLLRRVSLECTSITKGRTKVNNNSNETRTTALVCNLDLHLHRLHHHHHSIMTFLYFTSNLLVTYAPFYLLYKSTSLNEFKSFNIILQALCGNLITQVAKMMLLATFFPSFDTSTFSLYQGLVQCLSVVMDLFAIYFVTGFSQSKFAIATGWALADALQRLPQLWLGSLPLEFDSIHLIRSFESNTHTAHVIAIILLIGHLTKRAMKDTHFVSPSRYNAIASFRSVLSLSPLPALLSLAIFVSMSSISSVLLHVFHQSPIIILTVNVLIVSLNCFSINKQIQ